MNSEFRSITLVEHTSATAKVDGMIPLRSCAGRPDYFFVVVEDKVKERSRISWPGDSVAGGVESAFGKCRHWKERDRNYTEP
jgi:hypothetical protein